MSVSFRCVSSRIYSHVVAFFFFFYTGNAGGGAQRRPAGATGGPGDVHTANRGPAGRPGGSGVQRRKRHGEVTELVPR